jgi:hypothetical protein
VRARRRPYSALDLCRIGDAQIAHQSVDAIAVLNKVIDNPVVVKADLQSLIFAPWLIRLDWSVISENLGLKRPKPRLPGRRSPAVASRRPTSSMGVLWMRAR